MQTNKTSHFRKLLSLRTNSDLTFFAFWLFFLLGLTSNYSWALYADDSKSIWMTPLLTAFLSLCGAVPVWILQKLHIRQPRIIYIGIIAAILILLTVTDGFLYVNFSRILNQDIVDIIAETNANESAEFIHTYLSGPAFVIIAGAIALVSVCWILACWLSRHRAASFFGLLLSLGGLGGWGWCVYGYVRYCNGHSIPQYTSLTRCLYSGYILKTRIDQITLLEDKCRAVIQHPRAISANRNLSIILVIGESHSAFHTPAYGYRLNTFPRLEGLADSAASGRITWYKDIVSVDDHTHGAMKSIFSMAHYEDFASAPLFPAIFKSLGYHTALYDNQYLAGEGISFMSDESLSQLLYDYRNKSTMTDEDLVESVDLTTEGNSLTIIHLMGSHYTYASRYPHDRFSLFTSKDYPSVPVGTGTILAHYDNSLAYTDHILASLISRLSGKEAAIIYLSDHGEDLFEQNGFMGHGNAAYLPEPAYQLRVPAFIWLSEKYIASHPDKADMTVQRSGFLGMSDDIGHLLLDIAGEEVPDSTRSIINQKYKPPHRIVLHSLDFDNATGISF